MVILRMEHKTVQIHTNTTPRWYQPRAEAQQGAQRDQGDPTQD